jgi:raffinose/stachyose/melibiose transport system permease protein
MNSFKSKYFVKNMPLEIPSAESWVGLKNYFEAAGGLFESFILSIFINVCSVALIVSLSAMTAWFITRFKSRLFKLLFYFFVIAMATPIQVTMFPLERLTSHFNFNNPIGILFIYLGIGSSYSVFLYSGFIRNMSRDAEDSALIDGCKPIRMFFSIVLPMLSPIAITVAVINAIWIWNDFLIAKIIIGEKYKTIPLAIQNMFEGFTNIAGVNNITAIFTLAILPVIIFYFFCQKHIVQSAALLTFRG